MNKFLKQVVNSVAVQAAVYAVTEGGKVIWPKAKVMFNKVVSKVESGVSSTKNTSEFTQTLKNTEVKLKEQLSDIRAKKAAKGNAGEAPETPAPSGPK